MAATKMLIDGKEQYVVHGVFGDQASSAFTDSDLKPKAKKKAVEESGQEMFRYFSTKEAADAYELGISDMDGWMDYYISDIKEHQKVFGKIGKVITPKVYYQPDFDDKGDIKGHPSKMIFSFEVWRSKENLLKAYPKCTPIEYKDGDIEDPNYVD